MSDHSQFIENLMTQSLDVVKVLKADAVIGKYIDYSLRLPRPFVGTGEIRLVILGQDPTVEGMNTRQAINTVLMLDQKGSNLHQFLTSICTELGISLDENVYATNICKNFFTEPPNNVTTTDLISLSWSNWRPLLVEELARFPDAKIVTLGNPVLKVLVKEPKEQDLKRYWGHKNNWKKSGRNQFRCVDEQHSTVGRQFFPLPHIETVKELELYSTHFVEYLSFVATGVSKDVA